MIENYINSIVSQIKRKSVRKQIRNELLDHLTCAQENYRLLGMSEKEAQAQAISEFGDKETLIQSFNQIYPKLQLFDVILWAVLASLSYVFISNFSSYLFDNKIYIDEVLKQENITQTIPLNHTFQIDNRIYTIDKAIIRHDNLYLHFTYKKEKILMRYEPYTKLSECNNKPCEFTAHFPFSNEEEGFYHLNNAREGFIKIKGENKVPQNLNLTLLNIKEEEKTLQMNIERKQHE